MEARSSGLKLEMQRTLPAAPETVFEGFSDPSRLAKWWGPRGFAIPSLEFEVREGARYKIEMQPPDGDSFFLVGEFREVEPPGRLAFSFVWEEPHPDDIETLVELSIETRGESTEVTMRQGPFKTDERRELHRGGWSDSFDNLERLLVTVS